MKIDRNLNLVLNVERADGSFLHVHSTPIAHSLFEDHFYVMARTWTALIAGGLGSMTGPRVAAMMLKRQAVELGEWEGDGGVERGLIGEIRRLTNVLVPNPAGGWQTLPLDLALQKSMIDEEDLSEVNNALVFFTLASRVPSKSDVRGFLDGMGRFWGALITSSNVTEYAASLQTSTQADSSGAKGTASSTPT